LTFRVGKEAITSVSGKELWRNGTQLVMAYYICGQKRPTRWSLI